MLDFCFKYYRKHPTPTPFFQWLDLLSISDLQAVLNHPDSTAHMYVIPPQELQAFMKGVEYLDAAARVRYAVDLPGGCLVWQGKALDTAAMSTMFSGKGWAIWAMSPDAAATFYTNSHTRGEFHHSSFLSGKSVGGAGEWVVTNGKLKIISGKTGHYKAGCDELAAAIAVLHKRGVKVMSAKVLVYDDKSAEHLLNAWEFMNNKDLRKAYVTDRNAPIPTGKAPARNFTIKPRA
jgi:hypothetical protein